MRTKIFVVIIAIVGALASPAQAAPAAADRAHNYWEFSTDIRVTDGSRRAVAVPLEARVYAGARTDLADLRIVDPAGTEIPYLLYIQRSLAKEKRLPAKVIGKEVTQTESTLTVDLGEAPPSVNNVTIETGRTNFIRKVTLEGSDDMNSWTALRRGIVVYSFVFETHGVYLEQFTREIYTGYGYSRYEGSNLSFRFPEAKYRYLRIRMPHDEDKEPVEITGLGVYKSIESDAVEETFRGAVIKTQADVETKSVETIVDFGRKDLPISRIAVGVAEMNFFRQVEVYSSNDAKEWTRAGNGALFSISLDKETRDNTTLSFSEVRARYLKLKVLNGDNKPIRLTSVTAYGAKRFIVFIPEKDIGYRLLYGNQAGRAVSYDLAEVLRDKRLEDFGKGVLGTEVRNRDFIPYKEQKPWTEDKPYLLWIAMAVIGVGVIILGVQITKKT